VHLRLSLYKKLATAKSTDQVDALLEEIVDRFGKLPAAGPDADRRAPPARDRQALWRGQGRRRAGRDQHHLQEEPADRDDASSSS